MKLQYDFEYLFFRFTNGLTDTSETEPLRQEVYPGIPSFYLPPTQYHNFYISQYLKNISENHHISSLLADMELSLFGINNFSKMRVQLIFAIFLERLCELSCEHPPSTLPPKIVSLLKYIESNYNQNITLETLSNVSGISKSYIMRLFKRYTNKTVTGYITFIRLKHAAYLLNSTDMNITEIAQNTGFSDVYYFSKVFKKYWLISPSKYRSGLT